MHLIESTAKPWDEPMSLGRAMSFLQEVAAACVSGPYSEFLNCLTQKGELRKVVDFEVPFDTSLDDYRSAVQIQGLFKRILGSILDMIRSTKHSKPS